MFGHHQKNGAVVIDGRHIADTVQCVHCGSHEEIEAGSGKKRGFCPQCQGFVCGKGECMRRCAPFEARIELTEHMAAQRFRAAAKIQQKYPGILPY